MRERDVESTWLDIGQGGNGPSTQHLPYIRGKESLLLRLRRRSWRRIISKYFADTRTPVANPMGWGTVEMLKKLPRPDVWNLHWVAGFLEWEHLLPWMARQAPIVWTLHDLNPLRGVWHYEPEPEEQSPARLRYEVRARKLKQRALRKVPRDRTVFVAPSRWMKNECAKSVITRGFSVVNIPYSINTDIFNPRKKQLLREVYGIPKDAYIVGFVADHISAPRKGMHLLIEALHAVAQDIPSLYLLTVGVGSVDCITCKNTHLGGIENDHMLAHVYSACDVFVCPSTQDNLPNTVIESLACGTPVVAFNVGGLPDLINSPSRGRLAELKSGDQGLEKALGAMNKDNAGKARFSFELTAQRQSESYKDLYNSLLV